MSRSDLAGDNARTPYRVNLPFLSPTEQASSACTHVADSMKDWIGTNVGLIVHSVD